MTAGGSDRSPLPDLFPEASWLPLLSPVGSGGLEVEARINGKRVKVVLDTGATATALSPSVADLVGLRLVEQPGTVVKTRNALGQEIATRTGEADEIKLGALTFTRIPVLLVEDQRDLVLVGFNLLSKVDLYLAADQGLVGIFPLGQGPRKGAHGVASFLTEERRGLIELHAENADGKWVAFELILDTGATSTSIPVVDGMNKKVRTDLRYLNPITVVGDTAELRGRFRLDRVGLGPERYFPGPILAMGDQAFGGDAHGLLGTDVLARNHAVISPGQGRIYFFKRALRPPRRMLGPGNEACVDDAGKEVACVRVALNRGAQTCIEVDLNPRYENRTVELSVIPHDEKGQALLAGGAIHIFLTADKTGYSGCVGRQAGLERMAIPEGGGLALQWVRAEMAAWPCSAEFTHCMMISAPFPASKQALEGS
jgi:clan AA aspartic protease (TIGR02281 family)